MLAQSVVLLCGVLAVQGFTLGSNDVIYHLFTRTNPTASQPLLADPNIIAQSSFSLDIPTIITIHSYGETVSGNFNAHLVPAHLAVQNVNVIAVDYSRGAGIYTVGLGNAPQVGEMIANFINILYDNFGYRIDLIRIVGVGLGGHIAGIAARKVKGEIPHIFALDPSLIGWSHHPEKLHPDDADVVEVLYTTAGVYGYDTPLGDLNMYSNGGSRQTGCGTDISCSHDLSYVYYAESITAEMNNGPQFVGTACDNYAQAIALQCTGARDVVFGGPATKRGISGTYTFLTNAVRPFARG
ncbi:pancreatic triacylglycerol lipase-like [Epargyreus clarus]|uniref:pancreatic triacylglycerol lipase-like n=1 Tax=Epargyreus clarus TaxID=520877 RepID=UPI003C2F42C0